MLSTKIRKLCVKALASFAWLLSVSAAEGVELRGTVRDAASGEVLPGANIAASCGSEIHGTTSSLDGSYILVDLPAGGCTLRVSYVGFDPAVKPDLDPLESSSHKIDFTLTPGSIPLNPITVSASRRTERVIDAPAAISTVGRSEISTRPAMSPIEHLQGLPAVDIIRTGISGSRWGVRGFNQLFSARLMTLADRRIANLPGLRLNNPELVSFNDGDLERIEVLEGPGSALYGPNAAGGIVHYITRSPYDSQGTTVNVGLGERDQHVLGIRHAGVRNKTLGYKISARLHEGTDWPFDDPNEPDSLTIGKDTPDGRKQLTESVDNSRDYDTRRLNVDARVDFKPTADITAVMSGGLVSSDQVALNPTGAAQLDGWRTAYLQGRLYYRDWFAQIFVNKGDAGDSRLLRTGNVIIDNSTQVVAQVQHSSTFIDGRQRFDYGLDLLRTEPDSDGTLYGRNEKDDRLDEGGIYLQSVTDITSQVRLLATARLDHNSHLPDPVLSPRAAFVYRPAVNHTLRVTFNRAFETPPVAEIFSDFVLLPASITNPYATRILGVPADDGFNYRRDEQGGVDGLYMTSPFTPPAAGGPATPLPADAGAAWGAIVAIMGASGVDLSQVSAPNSDGATILREFNIQSFAYEEIKPSDVENIEPLRSRRTTTYEIGYKGVLSGRWLLSGNLYYERNRRFSVFNVITPNVFFEPTHLATHLAQFMSEEAAAALAGAITAIPVGTVSPREGDPVALLLSSRQFGNISHVGMGLGLAYYPSESWTFSGNYSHLSETLFKRKSSWPDDIAMNAPSHRGTIRLHYRDHIRGFDGGLRAHYTGGFRIQDVIGSGRVKSYTLVDLIAGADLPTWQLRVDLSIQNLLNNRHSEYIFAPRIGRLGLIRLSYTF